MENRQKATFPHFSYQKAGLWSQENISASLKHQSFIIKVYFLLHHLTFKCQVCIRKNLSNFSSQSSIQKMNDLRFADQINPEKFMFHCRVCFYNVWFVLLIKNVIIGHRIWQNWFLSNIFFTQIFFVRGIKITICCHQLLVKVIRYDR